MKSIGKIIAVAGLFGLMPVSTSADTLFGIYAGAGTWEQQFSGDVSSGNSTVDVEDDLALDDDSNTVFYVALEHGVPLLPNIRAQHFAIDVDGSNVLSRSIEFNGETFELSEDINTAIDLRQSDAVLYYEVLDNYLSLDLGLAVSFIEGSIDVASASQNARAEFDEVLPMAYVKTRVDLPLTGLWLGAEAQGVSYQDNSLMEFNAQLGYESKLGFGIEAGWRSVRIEVAEFDDVDSAKIDISGPYAALNYHF